MTINKNSQVNKKLTEDEDVIEVDVHLMLNYECFEIFTPFYIGKASFFENEIGPRKRELPDALSFYKSLDYENFILRKLMIYWENTAVNIFIILMDNFLYYSSKTFDITTLAKMELKYTNQFLETGINKTLFHVDFKNNEKIHTIYHELVYGNKREIFSHAELVDYRENIMDFFEHSQFSKSASCKDIDHEDIIYNYDELRLYASYFNDDWCIYIAIQVLVWYAEELKTVIEEKDINFSYLLLNDNHGELDITKTKDEKIFILKLNRKDEMSRLIQKSYEQFVAKKDQKPTWEALMEFIVKNPPEKCIVIDNRNNTGRLVEIEFQDIGPKINRSAFRKRFERYFNHP